MISTSESRQNPEVKPVAPFTFVLHGAAGDLARRKIIPALAHLAQDGYLPETSRIILSQREHTTVDEALLQEDRFLEACGDQAARANLQSLKPFLSTVSLTLGAPEARAALAEAVRAGPEPVVHYASLPASRFADLIHTIEPVRDAARMRLVLEKPLGFSGAESAQIERAMAESLDESQIYRIDHYLGKQAVQNLLALRLGNRIFEPLLTREHVAHVQITVAEDIGVAGRAGFYEHSGAIRDMVQSHMLQLLATVAMEPPATLNPDDLRDEKLKVLRALKVPSVTGTPDVVIGQYVAGHLAGQPVLPYLQEQGVAADSSTETFVAFSTEVQTWRWAGVPFLLRTGKRMPKRMAEIVIQFRDVPRQLFAPVGGAWSGNRLVIQLQPEDRLELHLLAKAPGERERLRPVALNLDFFSEWRIPVRDAYERLITDILRGRLSLFLRRDEVEAQWKFTDRLRDDLAQNHVVPLPYAAGTYGPTAATALALRNNAAWAEDARL